MPLMMGLLASQVGFTFQYIVEACESGYLDAEPRVLICNNTDVGVVKIAEAHSVPVVHISSRTHPDTEDEQNAIVAALRSFEVDWVVLAGWNKLIGQPVLNAYRGRVLNLHPAISPEFGGPGMYGADVHRMVLASGARTTGARIHLVDEGYDTGRTLAYVEVPVLPDDDVESVQRRVKEAERGLYVDTLNRIAKGELAT